MYIILHFGFGFIAWYKIVIEIWLVIQVLQPMRDLGYFKGDHTRTRASDSNHLPAVILNIFCEYTSVMFDIVIATKK